MSRDPVGTWRHGPARHFDSAPGESLIQFPVLGRIEAVRCLDAAKNKMKQTQVDISVYGGRAYLYDVPLLHSKINQDNGEDWTPEKGDMVVVVFLEGDSRRPIVVGFLPYPNNTVETHSADAPRYHRVRGSTWETWTKDGDRIVHVGRNESVTVVGDGTVNVGGNLTIVVDGDADITVGGSTTLESTGNVEVTAPLLHVTGDITSGGQVSDVAGSMAAMRLTYNTHTHPETGGTTSVPNQSM